MKRRSISSGLLCIQDEVSLLTLLANIIDSHPAEFEIEFGVRAEELVRLHKRVVRRTPELEKLFPALGAFPTRIANYRSRIDDRRAARAARQADLNAVDSVEYPTAKSKKKS